MKKVFVAYPYSLKGYREELAPAAENAVELVYADEILTNKHILEKITDLMKASDLSVFDLTGWNANVALELGVAIGLNLNYRILINSASQDDVFSDMRGWDQLRYSDFDELRGKLSALFKHEETFHRPTARLSPQEIDVQPYIHIDLHGGMSGPDGTFLEGFVRNVGEGIAREPMLRLPGLGSERLGGIMKPGETIALKFRVDDKPCYKERLNDLMASVEFEDRLGNLYRQEGPVSQEATPGGTILTYRINAFGLPYKVANREIVLGEPFNSDQPPSDSRRKQRTPTNQEVVRLGIGLHANALKETHFGATSEPQTLSSSVDVFDDENDRALERIVRRLPSCNSFSAVPVTEGAILSDEDFDAQSFGFAVNAIHVKTAGGIVVRFGVRGGHQLYDLYRTLGSIYALAKYMHRQYGTDPRSSVGFAFTILGEQYPNTLPSSYQGWFDMDVRQDSLANCATDAVVACLRAGKSPRESRSTVEKDLNDFWRQEFSSFSEVVR